MADPSTLIARALGARGVYPSTRLPLGQQALDAWRTRLAGELLRALSNDYDLVPRGEHERLRSAAARALERVEVSCDTSGAASEAEVILSQVVSLDGIVVVHRDLTAEVDAQRQLGVCPNCSHSQTVVNMVGDLFGCLDVVDGRRQVRVKGCGAQWRGARLGTPA